MNYNGNYFNNNMGGRMNYTQKPVTIKPTNAITAEEYRSMKRNGTAQRSKIEITDPELKQATCTHRDPESGTSDAVVIDHVNNIRRCNACGNVFKVVDTLDVDYTERLVTEIKDIIESVKFGWLTIPEDIVKKYLVVEAYLNKLPYIVELANKFMNSLDSQNQFNYNGQANSPFVTLNNLMGTSNPFAGMGGAGFNYGNQQFNNQQQFMNNGMGMMNQQQMAYNQQQMMGQQAQVNNGMQYNGNPFDASSAANVNSPNGVVIPNPNNTAQAQNNSNTVPEKRSHAQVVI